jgi:aminotransferase
MALRRSRRIGNLVQSDIRRMTRECVRAGGINLGQGICDTPTPGVVEEAAQEAILLHSTYSKFEGIDPLREAIARKLQTYNRVTYDPNGEVIVTIGATGAFAATVMALLDPGDEVILFEPYYGYHVNTLRVAGVEPVFVPMQAPNWDIDFAAVAAAITPRTRAILVNTPSNPCGKVWSRAEIEAVGELATRHDLLIFTDEIYEYLTFDGRAHISPASVDGLWDRTITISGYSKTFSITGWRLGYVAAPRALAEPIGLINDLFYVCAPTPLQHAVARGIEQLPDSYYTQLRDDYWRKRDMVCDALRDAGLTPYDPQGAYYVLADVTSLGMASASDAAMALLARTGVASVPGTAFFQGPRGEQMVRFCFAKSQDVLADACERLRRLTQG